MKLWGARFEGQTDSGANDFNSSIGFDARLYRQDITGSIAHAEMLAKCGLIPQNAADDIVNGLEGILSDCEAGKTQFSVDAEDIHMNVETLLTERIGENGKYLHTARSRNDQVALDLRLWQLDEIKNIRSLLQELCSVIIKKAEDNINTVMPGFTHLQPAQPVTFAHAILAYAQMFLRDIDRLDDCAKRTAVSPIGCCALAGTTYKTDRFFEAKLLGLEKVCENSMDGVSDRDFAAEMMFCTSLIMTHLSRFCEEIILWCNPAYGFIRLSDAWCTGSSIMPQKKNPDIAELVRGKTGRVYGDLLGLLTVLKGLPLAYNKDMQEDKESLFDAVDTVKLCLSVFTPMLDTAEAVPENMAAAAENGFINATDCADYLAKKGLPFRDCYGVAGRIVKDCVKSGKKLSELTLDEYKTYSPLFEADIYSVIDPTACAARRASYGGPAPEAVRVQIDNLKTLLR